MNILIYIGYYSYFEICLQIIRTMNENFIYQISSKLKFNSFMVQNEFVNFYESFNVCCFDMCNMAFKLVLQNVNI